MKSFLRLFNLFLSKLRLLTILLKKMLTTLGNFLVPFHGFFQKTLYFLMALALQLCYILTDLFKKMNLKTKSLAIFFEKKLIDLNLQTRLQNFWNLHTNNLMVFLKLKITNLIGRLKKLGLASYYFLYRKLHSIWENMQALGDLLVPWDFQQFWEEFLDICRGPRRFIFIWCLSLFPMAGVFFLMFFVGLFYFYWLWLLFLVSYVLIRWNWHENMEICYRDWIFFKEGWPAIAQMAFVEKPRKYAFFYFYRLLKLWTKRQETKFSFDGGLILLLTVHWALRFLVVLTTALPFSVLKMNTFFVWKLKQVCNFNCNRKVEWTEGAVINCLFYLGHEIGSSIYKLRVLIRPDSLFLNPPKIWTLADKEEAVRDLNKVQDIMFRKLIVYLMSDFSGKERLKGVIGLGDGEAALISQARTPFYYFDEETGEYILADLSYMSFGSLNHNLITGTTPPAVIKNFNERPKFRLDSFLSNPIELEKINSRFAVNFSLSLKTPIFLAYDGKARCPFPRITLINLLEKKKVLNSHELIICKKFENFYELFISEFHKLSWDEQMEHLMHYRVNSPRAVLSEALWSLFKDDIL